MLGLLGLPVVTINPNAAMAGSVSSNCAVQQRLMARPWIGKSEYQATNAARLSGSDWRVVRRDRENFPVTQDYSEARINLEFDRDRLTRASCG